MSQLCARRVHLAPPDYIHAACCIQRNQPRAAPDGAMADSARNSARPCSNIDTLNGHSAQRRRRDRIDKFCRFFIHLEAPYIFASDNIVAQKIKPDLIFLILLAIIYPPISANPTRPSRARVASNNSLLRRVGKNQPVSAALAGCPKVGAKSAIQDGI